MTLNEKEPFRNLSANLPPPKKKITQKFLFVSTESSGAMLLGKIFSGPDRKARVESLTAWALNYLFAVEASFIQTHF